VSKPPENVKKQDVVSTQRKAETKEDGNPSLSKEAFHTGTGRAQKFKLKTSTRLPGFM
jgi:hypothetical protein